MDSLLSSAAHDSWGQDWSGCPRFSWSCGHHYISPGSSLAPATCMCRLHGVAVAPRPGLPRGLYFFSPYAPLQDDSERSALNADFFEFVTSLDMQVPILFMGDFNGTVSPDRDYSDGVGPVCELLTFWAPVDRCLTCSSLRHLSSWISHSGEHILNPRLIPAATSL